MVPVYPRESVNFSWGKFVNTVGCGNWWKGQTQQTGDNNQGKTCKKLVFCRCLDSSRPPCFGKEKKNTHTHTKKKLKGL